VTTSGGPEARGKAALSGTGSS